jgi:hypothetical protein
MSAVVILAVIIGIMTISTGIALIGALTAMSKG